MVAENFSKCSQEARAMMDVLELSHDAAVQATLFFFLYIYLNKLSGPLG